MQQWNTQEEVNFNWVMGIAHLDTPRKRALWTKLRVLLYEFEAFTPSQPIIFSDDIGFVDQEPYKSFCPDLSLETYMSWQSLQTARFDQMGMTVSGEVIFFRTGTTFILDDFTLETGMILMCDFEHSGAPRCRVRINALDIGHPWRMFIGLGKGVEELMTNHGLDRIDGEDVLDGEK